MSFLSVENLQRLLLDLRHELREDGVDYRATNVPSKRLMYKIMCDIEEGEETAGMDGRVKTRLALATAVGFYRSSCKPAVPDQTDARRESLLEAAAASLRPAGDVAPAAINATCEPLTVGPFVHAQSPQRPRPGTTAKRFLVVNGYDRDWVAAPDRYRFRPDLRTNDAVFRGVRRIAATMLIVPREVVEVKASTSINPKASYRHAFGMPFPYLILNVDEFQNGACRASNEASSRALCHFVYDSCSETTHGRSYIYLKPMQEEALVFETPTSLDSMTLSVLQPSGALFNASKDGHRVKRVGTEVVNSDLLAVTLHKYFDINEFYEGDTVRFSTFDISVKGLVDAPAPSDDALWSGMDRFSDGAGATAYLVPAVESNNRGELYVRTELLSGIPVSGVRLATDSRSRTCLCVAVTGSGAAALSDPAALQAPPWTLSNTDPARARAAAGALMGGAWASSSGQDRAYVRGFNAFMNRVEGHRIEMISPPTTAENLTQTLFVRTPGVWEDADGQIGDFATDPQLFDALDKYARDATAEETTIGHVINMSLQVSVSFRIEVEQAPMPNWAA